MVNTSLKKLKHYLANFDVVVKEKTTPTAISEGSWGFEHTKACFRDEIISFIKALKDLFSTFNQHLVDELSEVQNVFYQMEQAVEQHRIESKTFEVKMNQVLNENERLLEQVMSKDIVNLLVNPSVENDSVNVHECQKCLKLETELQTDFVKRETYDKLFKSFTILEKHCISLEVDTQLKQEIFQRENSVSNQSVPSFDQLFELNELKAQSQEKDTVIKKLKERIKSLIIALVLADSTGLPSSTTVDQDAPSPSNSQTTPETEPLVIPNDVEEDNHDIEVAYMGNDPYFGAPIPEVPSDQPLSSDTIHTIVHPDHQISEHNSKWTKDHPLENIIGELARPVLTRLQLHKQALFCYYDAFLTAVEPKTYKDALTQACWIEAMQEELNEFERLEVWKLVPRPDKVMVITLKWIYKVKLDELGGILKNKARLVARGYR
ncbi:retrovirus-related pol polyprotein from transposon TNT 1-94 [Tanacetum coccineum]